MAYYTAEDMRHVPTLEKGQCCNLKVDAGTIRIWLCRVGGGITIETLDANGVWVFEDGGCHSPKASV